jgi:hypothetical protein
MKPLEGSVFKPMPIAIHASARNHITDFVNFIVTP